MTNTTTTTSPQTQLPPDPEGMNDRRAASADVAIQAFFRNAGTDFDDALGDLLTNLMHWADRNNYDFGLALNRARGQYEAETASQAPVLLQAARNALADLGGIMPEYDPNGDRTHPARQTIPELRDAITPLERSALVLAGEMHTLLRTASLGTTATETAHRKIGGLETLVTLLNRHGTFTEAGLSYAAAMIEETRYWMEEITQPVEASV